MEPRFRNTKEVLRHAAEANQDTEARRWMRDNHFQEFSMKKNRNFLPFPSIRFEDFRQQEQTRMSLKRKFFLPLVVQLKL